VSSQARHLWEVLVTAYQVLGLDRACGGDEVFMLLTLARVIEPTSKLDSIRVLTEVGIAALSYPTMKRRALGLCDTAVARCPRISVRRMSGWGRRRWCSTTSPCAMRRLLLERR
jgi:hypothetical protein